MDIVAHANALRLINRVFNNQSATEPLLPHVPQKPPYPASPITDPLPVCTPREAGVSPAHIGRYLQALSHDEDIHLHTLTLVRHGKVFYRHTFGDYSTDVWNMTFSMCKTVTALAIGMLVDEGKLKTDEKIVKIFGSRVPSQISLLTLKDLSVEHLLTMRSGITFAEAGSATEVDWIRNYFESTLRFEPGTEFHYNSMNTYMLSAIVRIRSGEGLNQFLRKRLWEPLGITNVAWERCPKGIEKGGWGLYLRPEDMAKIGIMMLGGGEYNGRRIVSAEWINKMLIEHVQTPSYTGDYNYGYQVWVRNGGNSFLCNGFFGQNVFCFKNTDIVAVTTGGNSELFQSSSLYPLTEQYFGTEPIPAPSARFYREPSIPRQRHARLGHRREEALLHRYCGSAYRFTEPAAVSVGLLPSMLQIVQNNYTSGISALSFNMRKDELYINVTESGTEYDIPSGLGKARQVTLTVSGENYLAAVSSRLTCDEDGEELLMTRITFLETESERIMKFRLRHGGANIAVEFTETPSAAFFLANPQFLTPLLPKSKMVDALSSKIDLGYLMYKVERAYSPVLNGTRVENTDK